MIVSGITRSCDVIKSHVGFGAFPEGVASS